MSKKSEHNVQSMIGAIVDMSLDDFEKELERQKVNVGTINNLILHLEAVYSDLKNRKAGLLNLIAEEPSNKVELVRTLSGLYNELFKVEEKIVCLKHKKEKLIRLDEEVD